MDAKDIIEVIKKHSHNPNSDYNGSWIIDVVNECIAKSKKSSDGKVSDFLVIDEMVNSGAAISASTNLAQVEQGIKGKRGKPDELARVTMYIDDATAQKLMQSMVHGTQEYAPLLFVVPYNEFIVKKNQMER